MTEDGITMRDLDRMEKEAAKKQQGYLNFETADGLVTVVVSVSENGAVEVGVIGPSVSSATMKTIRDVEDL